MKRCFEKNGAAKDSHFKKKNQFEKKKYGIISSSGLWPSIRDDPLFFTPQEITVYVRYFKPMFVSGN